MIRPDADLSNPFTGVGPSSGHRSDANLLMDALNPEPLDDDSVLMYYNGNLDPEVYTL